MTPEAEIIERLKLAALAMHQLRRAIETYSKNLDVHYTQIELAIARLIEAKNKPMGPSCPD